MVHGSGCRVQGPGCRVQGAGCRVQRATVRGLSLEAGSSDSLPTGNARGEVLPMKVKDPTCDLERGQVLCGDRYSERLEP